MRLQRRDIALAGLAATVVGITALAGPPARAQSADERAVAQAVDALTKAMIDVDRPKLEALTSAQLSYGHSGGKIQNRAEFIEDLMSRSNAFRFIHLSDQTISITENEAVVRHMFTAETVNPAGQVTPVKIGVLQVWRKEGGDWRLLARQAYKL